MDNVRVISSDIEGAALRREKRINPRHLRCDGKADDADINEAIQSKGRSWTLGSAWERIFGGTS